MTTRTERNPAPFTVADIAEFWAAIHDLQERMKHQEHMEAEQVARNLEQSATNSDRWLNQMRFEQELDAARTRLAKLERKEQGDARK